MAKAQQTKPIDPDAQLRSRIASYEVARAEFQLVSAPDVQAIVRGQETKDEALEARRENAQQGMEIHINMLEHEVKRSLPQTLFGCMELLEVAEKILASQEFDRIGAMSRGNVRLLYSPPFTRCPISS